ncbi:MAG: nucleotidyl transferase AbiEii/AbiGii toxin family protein [Bacteroidota bacterium]
MLQYTTVLPATLELLKVLMQKKCLANFNLVGGTSLALQIGHRLSIDIDLFTINDFDTSEIVLELKEDLHFDIVQQKPNTLTLNIEYPINSNQFIKVDILKYPYPLINDIIKIDGIRLLSIEDIIPMKLSAISNRGAKKDFYDIYFLLDKYSLKEMLELFSKKFPNINHFHLIKSLTYFNTADEDANPKVFKKLSWEQVKARIEKASSEIL